MFPPLLNIASIKIDQNSENIFENSENLKYLELQHSDFSNELPANIFSLLKKLKYLSVWNCSLKALNEKIFDLNLDLEKFYLCKTKLSFYQKIFLIRLQNLV